MIFEEKFAYRYAKRRLARAAAGLALGVVAAQILPVADTLVRSIAESGLAAPWSGLVVTALFALGGIEAACLLGGAFDRSEERTDRR